MFASRFYADRYYAPRYFPKVGADSVAVTPDDFVIAHAWVSTVNARSVTTRVIANPVQGEVDV